MSAAGGRCGSNARTARAADARAHRRGAPRSEGRSASAAESVPTSPGPARRSGRHPRLHVLDALAVEERQEPTLAVLVGVGIVGPDHGGAGCELDGDAGPQEKRPDQVGPGGSPIQAPVQLSSVVCSALVRRSGRRRWPRWRSDRRQRTASSSYRGAGRIAARASRSRRRPPRRARSPQRPSPTLTAIW